MASGAFADANEHIELIKARLNWVEQMDALLWRGVQFNTTIQNGLSRSVTKEVYARSFRVGSALDGNIVLLDDGIEAEHCVMSLKTSMFGPIMSVKALQGDILVNGQPVAAGTSSRFQALPQTITVSGVDISVAGSDVPGQRRREIMNYVGRVALLTLVFALFVFLVFQLINRPKFSFDIGLGYNAEQSEIGPQLVSNDLANVVERANAELERLGLSSSLVAEERESGSVAVAGTLMAESLVDWRKFQLWYDQNEQSVLLSEVSLAPNLGDVPPIASFGVMEPKYVRLATGRLIGIGDELHSGLILVDVTKEEIFLRRSDNGAKIMIPTGFDEDG